MLGKVRENKRRKGESRPRNLRGPPVNLFPLIFIIKDTSIEDKKITNSFTKGVI